MNFSMGISTFPTDGLDAETLLKNADNALYRTKQESGNSYQHYHSGMVNLQLSHLDMEKNLRKAIAENQLRLYYQPIIGLRTGKVKSVEALVRWEHPTLGLILPEIFIPYAEDSGLIIRLDQWVHEESFRQLKIWRKAGLNTPININTSPPELVQKNMIRKLETGLKKHGLTPQDIILELTETFLIKDMNKSVNAIQEIKQAGFRTALDDFGTGFASINYLRRLPVTYIKIDQVFVSGCVKNKEDAGIIQAMIAVAHHLNIKVIAEGVENRAQAEFLKKHGCDRVQGNYYSPPLSAERVTTILKKKYKV
jgi:EAL domain-containing protein (putative c-di-GMP-specific phosphodiesterase class I)